MSYAFPWLTLLHHSPEIDLTRLDSLFYKRDEQLFPYFTLLKQIFLRLFAHSFLRDQIIKVGIWSSVITKWKGVSAALDCLRQLMDGFVLVRRNRRREVMVASVASSGAIRKNFVRALAFSVIPSSPPDTFMERFRCSRALPPPTAQNGTSWFLFTTQLPLANSSYKRESVSLKDAISAR